MTNETIDVVDFYSLSFRTQELLRDDCKLFHRNGKHFMFVEDGTFVKISQILESIELENAVQNYINETLQRTIRLIDLPEEHREMALDQYRHLTTLGVRPTGAFDVSFSDGLNHNFKYLMFGPELKQYLDDLAIQQLEEQLESVKMSTSLALLNSFKEKGLLKNLTRAFDQLTPNLIQELPSKKTINN